MLLSPSHYPAYLVLALVASFSIRQSQCGKFASLKIDLRDKSFMLDVSIDIGANQIYTIQEMHSAWQARSKVHLEWHNQAGREIKEKADKGSKLVTFYANRERMLRTDSTTQDSPSSCIETSRDYLDQLFNLPNFLKGFDSGNLIGAARLLSFIQSNHEKFNQLTPASNERNKKQQAYYKLMFEANFNPGNNEPFTITLFYHEEAVQNLPQGIPRMIRIKTGPAGATQSYTFSRYQALKDDQIQASTSSAETVDQYRYSKADEVTFDLFAVDPSLGCSKGFKVDQSMVPKSHLSRFSFTARPAMPELEEPEDMTIVFEPLLDNLRVDQVYKRKSVVKIIDFQDNHQYHIMRKHSNAAVRESSSSSSSPSDVFDEIFQPPPDQQEHSCVVSPINVFANEANPYKMEHMLLGTELLAYSGLARVRGIEARVYEYHDCIWPIWLQQSSIYLDASSDKETTNKTPQQMMMRDDRQALKKRGLTMSNVFYFTKTGSDIRYLSQAQLLLVEILLKDEKTGAIIKRHSYSIFDFDWGLPSSSPAGSGRRYEDSFTLQNDCLAQNVVEQNRAYGTMSLLAEAKVDDNNLAWLQDRTKRNMALLRMLQRGLFFKPIAMVYDLESRLSTTTGVGAATGGHKTKFHQVSLAITFKAEERQDQVASLVFLGLGSVNLDYVDTIKLDNFQLCHMLAAHRREDIIFAFRAETFECHLVKREYLIASNLDAGDDLISGLMAAGTKQGRPSGARPVDEFYRIQHKNRTVFDVNRLALAKVNFERCDNINIYNPIRFRPGEIDDDEKIKLDIKSVHVIGLEHGGDQSDQSDSNLGDPHQQIAINKFLGFGLIAHDGSNKLVELKNDAGDQDDGGDGGGQTTNEMTFEHCQTACLADLNCRSFSVCQRHGVMSCVLSGVSFRTRSMVRQLRTLAGNEEAKYGEKFPIAIDQTEQEYFKSGTSNTNTTTTNTTIRVLKHRGCELHNKLYRDLFTAYYQAAAILNKKSVIYPVAHIEQCSELCFLTTIKFLKEQLDQFGDHQNKEFLSKRSPEIERVRHNKACDFFYYIERETIDLLEPERVEQFKKSVTVDPYHHPTPNEIGGYCALNTKYLQDAREEQNSLGQFISRRYEFDYLNLYTKQVGVSMVGSPLSNEARKYLIFNQGDPRDLEEIKPNENYGTEMIFSRGSIAPASQCARECFWPHIRTAYPHCQSFDFFVVSNPKEPTETSCGFNSMTLASASAANRTDLIRIGSDKQERVRMRPMDSVKVWHYELRPGLVANSVDLMYKIQLAEDIRATRASASQVHISGFSLFCGLILLLGIGIAIGITLRSRLLGAATETRPREDTDQLVLEGQMGAVNQQTKVEFVSINQPNNGLQDILT